MNDGGPAFPADKVLDSRGFTLEEAARGMSLRDLFAGMALPGLIGLGSDAGVDELAYEAYMYADAMIAKK